MPESKPSTEPAARRGWVSVADLLVGTGVLAVAGGAAWLLPAAGVIVIGAALILVGARAGGS